MTDNKKNKTKEKVNEEDEEYCLVDVSYFNKLLKEIEQEEKHPN